MPVVSDDFAATLASFTAPEVAEGVNPGYALITGHRALDDKTFMIAMSEVFAPWRTLFDMVLPAHAPHNPDAPGPSTGPFQFVEHIDGDRIVLSQNPAYRPPEGETAGDVDELRLVFPIDIRTMISDLEDGAVDVINPRPLDWMVEDIATIDGVTMEVGPGPFWEHITFNHADPLLSQLWVRQVIARALDLEDVLDTTVRTVSPTAPPMGNTVWMDGSLWFEDHFEAATDAAAAEQMLIDHLCELDDDDVYTCQGRRMSFVWATTVGDDYRETQVEAAVEQLEAIGVEIVPRLLTPSELFSTDVIFGDPGVWQIVSFSWKASPDPFLGDSMFFCQGDSPVGMGALNVARYCNEDVDTLIRSTRQIVDPVERAGVYNEADRLYLQDLAVIPLYQKPSLLAWAPGLTGPKLNPGATDLWNAGSWTGKPTVVMALEDEPEQLAPLVPVDDSSALLRSVLYQGAFRVTPAYEFLPALVSGAETVFGES
jgi:peptide/nickel transport system substrate-binding protein